MPKFREITGQFVGYVPDSIDPDFTPDREPMNGLVKFTPVYTGGVIAFPELSPPEFAKPQPIYARIVDGFVRVEVLSGGGEESTSTMQPLYLMVTVDDEATQVWSWRADFSNITFGVAGEDVEIPSWSFRIPDGVGPIDLTEMLPVKSSAGGALAKGPRGAGLQNITAVDGQLVFAYTDGEESIIDMPDAVQGPEGPEGPRGPRGEVGATGEKGDPGETPDLLVGNISDATPTGKNLMLAATEGAARNALGLAAGATAANGSLTELNEGTSSAPRVWTASNLSTFTSAKIDDAKIVANVKDYGAKGDGVADDTGSIQSAVDSLNSEIVIPSGTYNISSRINIRNTSIRAEPGVKFVSTNPDLDTFLYVFSSYPAGNTVELSGSATVGDRTLNTKSNHPYAPGDVLRLVSQRDSTRAENGDWQLGYQTSGGAGALYAEFVRVNSVPTATSIELEAGLVFPGYRGDAAEDNYDGSTSSAVLMKTNEMSNGLTISGIDFEGPAKFCVRVLRSKHVRLSGLRYFSKQAGRFIQFEDCYMCDAADCYVVTDQPDLDYEHASINSYHCVASWQTGFTRCTAVKSTQCFDITYSSTSRFTSVYCYVKDCSTESAMHNPLTTHPGTYASIITGNRFINNLKSGISIRSNNSFVDGNVVTGHEYPDVAGIYLLENGGRYSQISNNYVSGFVQGLRINDGAGKPFSDNIGVSFSGNRIENFTTGFLIRRLASRPVPSVRSGVSVLGNAFHSMKPGAVAINTCEDSRGARGLAISGNSFYMYANDSTAIRLTANSRDTQAVGNVFAQVNKVATYDPTGRNSDTERDVLSVSLDNIVRAPTSAILFDVTDKCGIRVLSGDILTLATVPHLDNFTLKGKFRPTASAAVTVDAGFPKAGGNVWWEVDELSPTFSSQTVHYVGSGVFESYTRRFLSGVWSPWVKVA